MTEKLVGRYSSDTHGELILRKADHGWITVWEAPGSSSKKLHERHLSVEFLSAASCRGECVYDGRTLRGSFSNVPEDWSMSLDAEASARMDIDPVFGAFEVSLKTDGSLAGRVGYIRTFDVLHPHDMTVVGSRDMRWYDVVWRRVNY